MYGCFGFPVIDRCGCLGTALPCRSAEANCATACGREVETVAVVRRASAHSDVSTFDLIGSGLGVRGQVERGLRSDARGRRCCRRDDTQLNVDSTLIAAPRNNDITGEGDVPTNPNKTHDVPFILSIN